MGMKFAVLVVLESRCPMTIDMQRATTEKKRERVVAKSHELFWVRDVLVSSELPAGTKSRTIQSQLIE